MIRIVEVNSKYVIQGIGWQYGSWTAKVDAVLYALNNGFTIV